MQYRICQGVDSEKSPKKTHLNPSELFYKMLIDNVLSFIFSCPRRRTLLQEYYAASKSNFGMKDVFRGEDP